MATFNVITAYFTGIWITCKKINVFCFLALTMHGAQYRLPLIVWPKLTNHAALLLKHLQKKHQ